MTKNKEHLQFWLKELKKENNNDYLYDIVMYFEEKIEKCNQNINNTQYDGELRQKAAILEQMYFKISSVDSIVTEILANEIVEKLTKRRK